MGIAAAPTDRGPFKRIDDINQRIGGLQIEIQELWTLFFESIGNQPSSAPAG